MTREILLNHGKVVLVDDNDFDYLNQFTWHVYSDGYVRTKNNVFMHRILLNPIKGMVVDHINHDKLDNRRCNLRICTQSQNMANSLTTYRTKSGYKGVTFFKPSNKWKATIVYNYQRIHLGLFDTILEAKNAYEKKARELFGEFALIEARMMGEEE